MTLKEACRVVFKGAISPATLKAEGRRGNLVIHKIGRAHFVPWRELSAMWEKCQMPAVRPVKADNASRNEPVRGPALASAQLSVARLRENARLMRKQ
jgi:hypothetical protein